MKIVEPSPPKKSSPAALLLGEMGEGEAEEGEKEEETETSLLGNQVTCLYFYSPTTTSRACRNELL